MRRKESGEVVKASSGHYPLPFLISTLKNCCKYTTRCGIGKQKMTGMQTVVCVQAEILARCRFQGW
jgi:hypothetical protein